jgi:uncharacterized protein YcbK (DUF882 family)
MTVSRRSALILLSAAAVCAAPRLSLGAASGARRLSFEHLHTGERIAAVYRTEAGYDHAALRDIDHLLRDWRTGDVKAIDPALLDDVFDVQARLGHSGTIRVICGYRSPKTNAGLASKSRGVAKRSLHLQGRAIDLALPGVSTLDLRDAALAMSRGGVGTYTRSGFVHLDTGRVRHWGS